MKTQALVSGVFLVLLTVGTVAAASFDCDKAASEVEKFICGDDELSKLDESLNTAYLKALERPDIRKQLTKSQRQWLKKERNGCRNAECLKKAYAIRIWELGLSSSYGTVFFRSPDRSTSSPKALPEESQSQPTEPRGQVIQTEPGQEHEETRGSVDETAVFYHDEYGRPVVRLDRLPNCSDGLKAILALYALENGAGCDVYIGQGLARCALTRALGLGANCSEEHIRFVRSWFKFIPKLTSRLIRGLNDDSQKAGSLEDLCYARPDTASSQNIWEIIRVSMAEETVTVDAILCWGSQYGHGRIHYRNIYTIKQHTVTEVSSRTTELERSEESIFKGGD